MMQNYSKHLIRFLAIAILLSLLIAPQSVQAQTPEPSFVNLCPWDQNEDPGARTFYTPFGTFVTNGWDCLKLQEPTYNYQVGGTYSFTQKKVVGSPLQSLWCTEHENQGSVTVASYPLSNTVTIKVMAEPFALGCFFWTY